MSGNGKKLSFLELLSSCEKIVIPKIQRDYAQGRIDTKDTTLCQEVRDMFIASINNALLNDEELVLDYIYGSKDNANFFYPIDGQQRLTTLFLLHWYIGLSENKLDNNIKIELKKFSYEIRDTATEFCRSLIDINFDVKKTDCARLAIINSSKYFRAYDNDPTIQAMLVMIEKLHEVFRYADPLWDRLCKITFWALSLEKFGLTDDLFVKMNARGKRLSRFDTFKSDLESALDKRSKKECTNIVLNRALDQWKINIDNEYLDSFWSVYGKENAERNIFRLIIFIVKGLESAKNTKTEFDDSWERNDKNAQYGDEVKIIARDEDVLQIVCKALATFKEWKDKDAGFDDLLVKKTEATAVQFHVKVKLFGILYWWATIDNARAKVNFDDFYRILHNYVNSAREPNIRDRQYNSSIDKKSIGGRFEFVKMIIDAFNVTTDTFCEFIKNSVYKELVFEREKLNYFDIKKIFELEQSPVLNTLIHNLFFGGKIHVEASELESILADSELKNYCLRIILGFADDRYGHFNDLVFDSTTIQSGKRQLYYDDDFDLATGYCHKYFIKNATNGFGDRILTSAEKTPLSNAVKAFAIAFHDKYYGQTKTVRDVLIEMLDERLNQADFKDMESIKWYIVKYREFFYADDATTFLVLRRKKYGWADDDDNVYDIRCTNEFFALDEPHYQPFYLALSRYLADKSSTITIDESALRIRGNQIEYAYPCRLSNGWTIRIQHKGSWKVIFEGNMPSSTIVKKYGISSKTFELKNNGVNCVELIGNFIIECN